jgi:hypothetical protein
MVNHDVGSNRHLCVSSHSHNLNIAEKLLDCLNDTDRRNPGYNRLEQAARCITLCTDLDHPGEHRASTFLCKNAKQQSGRLNITLHAKMPHVNLA